MSWKVHTQMAMVEITLTPTRACSPVHTAWASSSLTCNSVLVLNWPTLSCCTYLPGQHWVSYLHLCQAGTHDQGQECSE